MPSPGNAKEDRLVKLLDRYIFREIAVPAVVALIALTFMLVARELGVLLELIVRRSASGEEIRALAAALIPGAMTFTIPVALLVGVLSGMGRLSSDSEIVALRATGVSVRQILRPILALGLLAWTGNLVLSVWIAPEKAADLARLTTTISLMRQLPLELEPRVFNEDIPGLVIYVQDMSPDGRVWSGVLLADVSDPDQYQVTWARSGRLASNAEGTRYEITLLGGSTEIVPRGSPEDYRTSVWEVTTIPVPVPQGTVADRPPTPQQIPTSELIARMRAKGATFTEEVEFHRRLALPFACIAFLLVGLPLGISTRRGGRSIGLVLSALLMLAYYAIFIGGTGTAAGNAVISPMVGTWAANIGFALLGVALLVRSERSHGSLLHSFALTTEGWMGRGSTRKAVRQRPTRIGTTHHGAFFRTLDLYVVRTFFFYLTLVAVAFIALVIVVTLFELLPDIVEHDAPLSVVVLYFAFYTPQILYLIIPLAILVAVFITLGSLTRSNETLAVRAGAISLYRMVWPLVAVALCLSTGLYLMGDYLLPYTNQKQDAYRDSIKGRAPQTYLDPARKWMAGSGGQIYFYNYFDPEENTFADLSVFEFGPDTWQLGRWTFAARAVRDQNTWRFEDGWSRRIGSREAAAFQAFDEQIFPQPMDDPSYFKREVRIASQMNYPELRAHIDGLRRAGFEVGRLTVELYRKVSFPIVAVVMALLAIPFALSTGRRGAFYGIGVSIIIGISYWATFELFEKLGGMSEISPIIAAWFPNLIFGFGGIWMLLKVRT